MINKNSKIFVAGHNGLIGSAIIRKLENLSYKKIYTKSKKSLDLRDQKKVLKYFSAFSLAGGITIKPIILSFTSFIQ